nr:alpha/beta hydrolase [Chelativorans sp. Marseille-P2723]
MVNISDFAHLRVLLLVSLALLAGCMHPHQHRLLAETIAPARPAQVAAVHRIYVATSRASTEEPGVVFSGERAHEPSYALVDVSVPAIHETGKLELAPSPQVADPARYFAALRAGLYKSETGFRNALARNIAAHDGRLLVFVHGYNTSFDAAVYRMTQIVHDSGYRGLPLLFTWPSAGRAIDYIYDNNSATVARDALEHTLRLVARSGAQRIDIVAHSMGSWVTMEALRQLAITGDRNLGGKLADVVLASPDIDVDVFKAQMRRYGDPDRSFFILNSRGDKALDLSGFIAGNRPRLGGAINAEELAEFGVIVIDVTQVSSPDFLGHTKFAENPLLIRLLGEGLAETGAQPLADQAITRRLANLARGIGQTVGSAAELVVTTPFEVLDIAVGN